MTFEFRNGGECAIAAQPLVKRMPAQARLTGQLRHAASTGDYTEDIGSFAGSPSTQATSR